MRFISGLLVALLFVVALIIVTAPDHGERPVPSAAVATTAPPAAPSAAEVARIGAVRLTPAPGWQKMTPAGLGAFPELQRFQEIAERAPRALILMAPGAEVEISGLLMVMDLGRSTVDPADVIKRAAAQQAEAADGSIVLWRQRTERIGTVDSVSLGLRFSYRGEIGTRAMRANYYAATPGGRGLFIVAIGMLGSEADIALDRMIASLREI